MATIVIAIEQGLPFPRAADFAGVERKTAHAWLRAGKRSSCKDKDLRQFARDVDYALASLMMATIKPIRKAGKKDWRANAWFAEARFPELRKARDIDPDLSTDLDDEGTPDLSDVEAALKKNGFTITNLASLKEDA